MQIIGGNLVLKLRDPEPVLSCLPGRSKIVEHEGVKYTLVRHGHHEAKVLSNLGFITPPAIHNPHRYDWPGTYTPMEHQQLTAEFATRHRRLFILNDPRTGKTISSLWAADFLMRERVIRKCLIISTLSTLQDVWAQHVFEHLDNRQAAILHGTKAQRLKALSTDSDFFIINHDGVYSIQKELEARQEIDLVIVDESACYRTASTRRWKSLNSLLRPDSFLWMMTGTPCPTSPTDAWAQAKLVSPDRVPKYFTRFKEMTMTQINTYKWVPKPDAYKIAYDAMQPAIRIFKRDVLKNLPPVTYEYRHVELTDDQKRAYRAMHNTLVMQAKSGDSSEHISAVNAADQINKLRQIACGVIKLPSEDDKGEYVKLDYGHRFSALMEAIEEAGGKLIVFVPYKGILRDLKEKLTDKKIKCDFVNGDVSKTNRSKIFWQFEHDEDFRVLLAHPQVAAHGLELAFADTIVWYAPMYSQEFYAQANERIASARQKNPMTIINLWSTDLEKEIYEVLKGKGRMQDKILDLYRKEVTVD